MTTAAPTLDSAQMGMQEHHSGVLLRTLVIGLTAFLTVVDLFATQAILPTLTRAYGVTPAAMGFAVNSSTMGMAAAGLVVALFSRRIDRRLGILISLAVRRRARFEHLYHSADRARTLHGILVHLDACLSR
jgi:YNFM family putative membrane transporter